MPESRKPFIVGADLSSSFLAFAHQDQRTGQLVQMGYELGTPWTPRSCYRTMQQVWDYIGIVDKNSISGVNRLAYVEAPIVGRGGVRSTQVQSFISGVVQAVLVSAGFTVYLVNVQTWKRVICGNGHASKADVVAVVSRRWPTGRNGNQDFSDAAAILAYGQTIEAHRIRGLSDARRG